MIRVARHGESGISWCSMPPDLQDPGVETTISGLSLSESEILIREVRNVKHPS